MSDSGDDGAGEERPSDTMRERVPESSRKFWVLLDAPRWALAAGIAGVVFLALVVLGHLHPLGTPKLFATADPVETLFQGLLGSIITGVTLVLTLSQLVLSQELGAVGDQRDRMEGATAFREDVADLLDEPVSPAMPSAFLRALVSLTEDRVNALETAVEDIENDDLRDAVAEYAENLRGNADAVEDQLDGAQFGEFDVVWAALNYNYSWKIYAAKKLRAEHRESLTEDAETAFDDLVESLELFGPAREHFKTLYFQWELVNLSRTLIYAAVPALTTAIATLVYLEPRLFPGAVWGVEPLVVVVAAAATVSVVPFAILLAYILRIITVTKRTLSIGSFILRETERSRDLD
ncbi:hypothetical protein [Salarchaeum japonicum]|uniref:Uncharacterized protein n=1 Tax=Salarchaeum japonicum TaxID=555573 RepID=A0AAV3SZ44_9EURY|nr:hypothetical protein [Salarchaeum japonicum]